MRPSPGPTPALCIPVPPLGGGCSGFQPKWGPGQGPGGTGVGMGGRLLHFFPRPDWLALPRVPESPSPAPPGLAPVCAKVRLRKQEGEKKKKYTKQNSGLRT